jgi:hypothetical protein
MQAILAVLNSNFTACPRSIDCTWIFSKESTKKLHTSITKFLSLESHFKFKLIQL